MNDDDDDDDDNDDDSNDESNDDDYDGNTIDNDIYLYFIVITHTSHIIIRRWI